MMIENFKKRKKKVIHMQTNEYGQDTSKQIIKKPKRKSIRNKQRERERKEKKS